MVKSLLFEVCTLMTVQVNSKNKSTGDDAFAFYNYEKADNQSIFFLGSTFGKNHGKPTNGANDCESSNLSRSIRFFLTSKRY